MTRFTKAHILLVLVTLIWGVTFVQIKDALRDISPLFFNAVRMTLAATALGLLFWRHQARISRAAWIAGAIAGAFLWLGYEFQTLGLERTTPSKSAFLTGVSVVLVPIFLALGFRRHINHWTLGGVGLAFAGLFLMTVPAGEESLANWASVNSGDLLTLGCAVCFAWQIIFLGRATQAHPFQQIAFLQTAICALLMALTIPLVEEVKVAWSSRVIWAILVTGLLGTAAAFTVQAWAQQFTPPTHTALIFALEPVFAWITSYLLLGERLGLRAAGGAALILSGILLSELKGSAAAPQGTAEELGRV